MKNKVILIVGLIFGILLVVGGIYYFTQNHPATNNQTGADPLSVEISNFAFSPSTLTVKAGDSVTWTNKDSVSHTITSDSGSELGSSPISSGGTYSHTFNTAGTYSYHCSIHVSMKGTVIVE